jgi:hypothetical protein
LKYMTRQFGGISMTDCKIRVMNSYMLSGENHD